MNKVLNATVLFFMILASGCQNAQTRTGEGALIGGVLGAAAGGIIGHQSGHGGEGAAIGVAGGALTGALLGSQVRKTQQGQAVQQQGQAASASYNNPNQISLQKVAELSKQGINEYVIIDKIRLTGSRYNLSPADIEYLNNNKVSPKVISEMQAGK